MGIALGDDSLKCITRNVGGNDSLIGNQRAVGCALKCVHHTHKPNSQNGNRQNTFDECETACGFHCTATFPVLAVTEIVLVFVPSVMTTEPPPPSVGAPN